MRKPALGRGLDAILGTARAGGAEGGAVAIADEREETAGAPLFVDIERVMPGRGQPRRRFDEEALDELAASIRARGILQPLIVTESKGSYELIAGERRLRAAARAGLDRVPVIVKRDVETSELAELALIENVQREDLTPIEQARGYQRLIDEHSYTQEQLAQRIGKSRVSVTNSLRLLKLPTDVCTFVDEGKIAEGHARALLSLPTAAQQIRLAGKIARQGLSVRETEEIVRRVQRVRQAAPRTPAANEVASAMRALEQELGRRLGTRVRIRGGATRGRIEIEYYSQEELDGLSERLGR